jgi:hypothetical protein
MSRSSGSPSPRMLTTNEAAVHRAVIAAEREFVTRRFTLLIRL